MQHILIVYGTTDGHTRKIAQVLAEDLRANLCCVDTLDASGPLWHRSAEGYDGVIVAASVHIGDYQRAVARWVRAHAPMLNTMPTAFLSVCLAVVERRIESRQEILRIMKRFLARCGWQPTITKMVAGALPYTRYGWLKRQMMKRIVAKGGGDTDTTRDYEYTDWVDLRNFAQDFAALAAEHEDAALLATVAEGFRCEYYPLGPQRGAGHGGSLTQESAADHRQPENHPAQSEPNPARPSSHSEKPKTDPRQSEQDPREITP